MTAKGSILIVEDNLELAQSLSSHLQSIGFAVEHASDGERGLELALSKGFDLAILDIELPKRTGVEICREMRNRGQTCPILMLTSRAEEVDEVVGLDAGADDYVTKPFGLSALVARINALLRRPAGGQMSAQVSEDRTMLRFAEIAISPEKRKVFLRDAEVELTVKEFEFLLLLASNPGYVFTRDDLLREIWQTNIENYQNAISTLVLRLRKKIEADPNNPRYVLTVRGVGYRFAELRELQ